MSILPYFLTHIYFHSCIGKRAITIIEQQFLLLPLVFFMCPATILSFFVESSLKKSPSNYSMFFFLLFIYFSTKVIHAGRRETHTFQPVVTCQPQSCQFLQVSIIIIPWKTLCCKWAHGVHACLYISPLHASNNNASSLTISFMQTCVSTCKHQRGRDLKFYQHTDPVWVCVWFERRQIIAWARQVMQNIRV